jgi:hypothetical protein
MKVNKINNQIKIVSVESLSLVESNIDEDMIELNYELNNDMSEYLKTQDIFFNRVF